MMSSQTLTLVDGRQLGYAFEGEGIPVVYFHGTASSRLEIRLLRNFASTGGFKIVGFDRPGFGLSTFAKRMRLRDFIADVNALVDYLKLDKFAVLGWSGGGPFALTYTALNPDRVTNTVIVGSPALPFDPASAHNGNPLAKYIMKTPFIAKWALGVFRKSVLNASQNIESYLRSRGGINMVASWPASDAQFFADSRWLGQLYTSMAEGFRQGDSAVEAIYQEHRLFMKPWNEPVTQIPEGKLTVWQGSQDKTCPSVNAEKIVALVKGARLKVFPKEGHCVMFANPEELGKELSNLG